MQASNFDFFITMGMGFKNQRGGPAATQFVVVVNGEQCSPCARLYPALHEEPAALDSLSSAHVGRSVTVLQRVENEGMDFAAHNITLTWLHAKRQLG